MCRKDKPIKLTAIIDFIDVLEGTERQLLNLIQNINTKEFSFSLICLRDSDWMIQHKKDLPCHVEIFNFSKLKHPRVIIQTMLLFRHIKNSQTDIVLTFFPLSNIFGVIIAKLAKVSTVISSRRDHGLWLDNKVSILFLRFANKYVDRIITNSFIVRELASQKEKVNKSRIDVIYNGIEITHLSKDKSSADRLKTELGIPQNNKIVGILAGLRYMKRHVTYIKAAEIICRMRNDISFLIVGDGSQRHDLEKMTKKTGCQDHIIFAGRQENIVPYLSLFDIGINCSSAEGLSNAIMEYMAMGIPCIVSDSGGNPELVTDGINGLTFKLDDCQALAKLIIDLLKDKQKQSEYIKTSKKKINAMTTEKMVSKYEKLFTNALK